MINPSLAYEILMYLNSFYFGMFASVELGMGILKAINLTYDHNQRMLDMGILVSMIVLETIRIFLGQKGSLAERSWQVFLSVFLLLPVLIAVVYLLFFQTKILKMEYILCALTFALLVSQLFFAICFLFTMCRRGCSPYYVE